MSESRVPTPNGEPIKVSQLNLGEEISAETRLIGRGVKIFRNMSLFLAGMYTGIRCGGTPNRYHSFDRNNHKRQDDGPV